MLDVGQKAPLFNLLDQSLNRFELGKALTKGKILLVFYPGDNTPVCTAQLCDYRDNYKAFEKLGVQIYGINISTTESHKAFAEKLHLPFPLLNDYDSRVTKSYKVMSFMGTPKRALFLIGEDGNILYKYVELLPIFRRSSEELLKEVKKILPQPTEAVSQS